MLTPQLPYNGPVTFNKGDALHISWSWRYMRMVDLLHIALLDIKVGLRPISAVDGRDS